MDYKVLYRKYRPQDFDSVVGQEYTTTLLKNIVKDNKVSHAYIFTGPRGTGKTSSAKIFARAINCLNSIDGNPCNKCENCKIANENPDIIEIDAASNNSVDDIRDLIENSRLAAAVSKYKVYIIDEFHMLSTSAFNALLLTLEEPPSNVVFILATTDIQSVPITVLSRCQRFDFKPISNEDIVNRLKFVCKKEKIKISDEALEEISYMSNGGLRDALSILDQISSKDGDIDVDDIIKNFGSISTKKVKDLINKFNEKNVDDIIDSIRDFKENGIDYRILTNKLINEFKNILIDMRKNKFDKDFNFDDIYDLIFELSNSLNNTRNTVDPYIFIEIILLKYINVSRETLTEESDIEDNVSRETLKQTPNTKKKEDIKKEVLAEEELEEQPVEEIVEPEEPADPAIKVEDTNKSSIQTNVRINNCFVNAKREYLAKIKEKWNDFLIYESNANKSLMSYIVDTDIVAASDQYAILTNKLKSAVELINNSIATLEKDFNIFYNMSYKFICLDNDEWKENQEKYIFNIKNKIKYSIIEEADESYDNPSINEDTDELEKLAAEIFDNNVEIK